MDQKIMKLKKIIADADAVMIGAGAGLSTAAGFVYSGERFDRYFGDFGRKYGFFDMYSGGFYPYETQEEFWAFFSRNIWVNRYMDAPKSVYQDLFHLVKDKDYFVLTTNVDHCFQKAEFDKKRLFYTQGDYGLFQCSKPCCQKTWDNEAMVRQMILSQGFVIGEGNALTLPEGKAAAMRIPTELLPKCPMPQLWAAPDHQPARGQSVCGGRGLADRRGGIRSLDSGAPGKEGSLSGDRRWVQHARHHQIQLLAAGIPE